MRDHDDREPELLAQVHEQFVERGGADRVQAGGRFVEHEQDGSSASARASAARLIMPPDSCAGYLRAASSGSPTSRTLSMRELFERARRQLQVLEHGQLDVLQHCERGEQRALLKGDAVRRLDLAQLGRAHLRRGRGPEPHFARLRALQSEDRTQQHRFSRARAADDAEHFAALDRHVESVVDGLRAEAVHQPADFDHGFR